MCTIEQPENFKCLNCGKHFHYWGEDAKKICARLILNDMIPTFIEMNHKAKCCKNPNIIWI